ncbi:MAG TPA: ribosome maturation factor RimM [Chromatiales bacterium]|nr:ribosome maturation factor RimM [Thiotrichales bacterium]HIP67433.1 ribosome maturation factor RimM [Chromatiales bacterium]
MVVGRITGVFGVKGWVKVFSHTQPKENILTYSPWLLKQNQNEWQEVDLVAGHRQGKGIVASLEGCTDRDQAAALKGADIAIRNEQLASLAKDEFYWADLIGLTVLNQENLLLGKVESLIETGANDVLVVRGEQEVLIPFAMPQIIKQIDLDAGQMIVDWQPE